MRVSRRALLSSVIGVVGLLVLVPTAGLYWLVHQKNILPMTEQKVGEILGAQVRIGSLKVGLFNEVDVAGLEITEKDSSLPISLDVAQIKVRYNWLSLLRGKSMNPATIILKAPTFRLGKGQFPFDFFRSLTPSIPMASVLPAVEFRDGIMEFDIAAWNQKIRATRFSARFQVRTQGVIEVSGSTVLEGLAAGKLEFHGVVNPQKETFDFNLKTRSIQLTKDFPVPVEALQGDVRVTHESIRMKQFEAKIYGWNFAIAGFVKGLSAQPRFEFSAAMPGQAETIELKGSLAGGRLTSVMHRKDHAPLTLKGDLEYQAEYVRLKEAVIHESYLGEILLDLVGRTLQMHFEEIGTRYRFDLRHELQKANAGIQLQLDHYDLSGLDVTTDMTIALQPVYFMKQGRLWKFNGEFHTNYFILETAPLEDFRGSFELSSEGVDHLAASWGKHFNVSGKASLKGSSLEGDLEVQIRDYDVAGVENLLNKPLPKKLGGILTGKIQLKGLFPKPGISGHLSIQDGLLGNLEYDLAMIQLAGVPPVLYLKDSKVYRGRTKLDLTGMINLTLPNILHDIRYQQPDNLIAYKAFQWEADHADGDIEVKKRGLNLPSIAIKTAVNSGGAPSEENKDKQTGEKYIAVGPKIRF